MKIYVVGSNTFMHEMVELAHRLIEFNHEGWLGSDYEKLVNGEMNDSERLSKGEGSSIKIERDYLRMHYRHILESDAILVVNGTKNGINGYVGGNVLIEMGQAYVNDKMIFLLNGLPESSPYLDEIKALEPISLHANLTNIKNY